MKFLLPSIKFNNIAKSDFGEYYTTELDISTYFRLTNGRNWFKIELRLLGFGIKYNWKESNRKGHNETF